MPEQLLAPPATDPEPDDQKQEPGRREALDPTALGPTGCAASRTRSPRGRRLPCPRGPLYRPGRRYRPVRPDGRQAHHPQGPDHTEAGKPATERTRWRVPDGVHPVRWSAQHRASGSPAAPCVPTAALAYRRRWPAGWSGGTAGSVMVRCR